MNVTLSWNRVASCGEYLISRESQLKLRIFRNPFPAALTNLGSSAIDLGSTLNGLRCGVTSELRIHKSEVHVFGELQFPGFWGENTIAVFRIIE